MLNWSEMQLKMVEHDPRNDEMTDEICPICQTLKLCVGDLEAFGACSDCYIGSLQDCDQIE